MKKYFLFIILLFPLFFFCGCNDDLSKKSPANVTYSMDLTFDEDNKML